MKLTKDEKKALSALSAHSDIWAEKFPDGKWLIHGSKVRGRTLEGLIRKRMIGSVCVERMNDVLHYRFYIFDKGKVALEDARKARS